MRYDMLLVYIIETALTAAVVAACVWLVALVVDAIRTWWAK